MALSVQFEMPSRASWRECWVNSWGRSNGGVKWWIGRVSAYAWALWNTSKYITSCWKYITGRFFFEKRDYQPYLWSLWMTPSYQTLPNAMKTARKAKIVVSFWWKNSWIIVESLRVRWMVETPLQLAKAKLFIEKKLRNSLKILKEEFRIFGSLVTDFFGKKCIFIKWIACFSIKKFKSIILWFILVASNFKASFFPLEAH